MPPKNKNKSANSNDKPTGNPQDDASKKIPKLSKAETSPNSRSSSGKLTKLLSALSYLVLVSGAAFASFYLQRVLTEVHQIRAEGEEALQKNSKVLQKVENALQQNPNPGKLYDGHSLFLDKMKDKTFEEGEQKILMIIILDVYNRIFNQMENETQDENLKHDLQEVKEQMNRLKEHYFSGKHAVIKRYVTELLALKENDPRIQSKAIFELKTVYNKAAVLGTSSADNHRRRRHAKHSKKQRS